MNLIDICRIANISYKDKTKTEKFLSSKKCEVYSINEIDEYKYLYFISNNILYISIIGSYNFENFLEGVFAKSINEGFVKILHSIMQKEILFNGLVNKLIVTGHSLGGSIAIKLANHIKSINKDLDVKAYAFVPMKPYRNKFKNTVDVIYLTVEGDFVNLFPFNYHIDGVEVYFDKRGRIRKPKTYKKWFGFFKGIFRKDFGVIESHKIEILLKNIKNNEKELRRLGLWE